MADRTPRETAAIDQKRAEVREVVDLLVQTAIVAVEEGGPESALDWGRNVLTPLMELEPIELRLIIGDMVHRLAMVEIRLRQIYGSPDA